MGHRKGIKVTSYVAISKMTIVDIGSQPDTGAATFFGATGTHFGINQGFNDYDVTFDIYGKGFKYKGEFGGAPHTGTVKKVEVRVGDELALIAEKLKVPALEALKLFEKDDPFAAFAKLLVGDDTIIGSDFDDPQIWGGKGNDLLWGRLGNDILDGSKGDDVNDGGGGNDSLIDIKGYDVFQFSTDFLGGLGNLNYNFDTIQEFGPKDTIYLGYNYFTAAGMTVEKGELAFSQQALDGNDFFLFFNNTFYYDHDANGGGFAPTPIFATVNNAKLTHKVIEIGYEGY